MNDSVLKTVLVAFLLCAVCSVVVSFTAVELRPLQQANALLERKVSILAVAGLNAPDIDVEGEFARFEVRVVDLPSGRFKDYQGDPMALDTKRMARDPANSMALEPKEDIAVLRRRENLTTVYVLPGESGGIDVLVLPVRGYGLWGTLYGYVAISGDLQRVVGLAFYEHKETPGLGGEVDNPNWRALWQDKKIYGEQGDIRLAVLKGAVTANSPDSEYQVDGLAGATLTSKGVSNLIKFWLGEMGFGPFLAHLSESSYQTSAGGAGQ